MNTYRVIRIKGEHDQVIEITVQQQRIQYSRHRRGGIIMALPAHDTEIRPNHLWAGDAGQIAAGKAGEVYMLKTGQKEPEDLSGNEAVEMGLSHARTDHEGRSRALEPRV
jgi:hypothetical protein